MLQAAKFESQADGNSNVTIVYIAAIQEKSILEVEARSWGSVQVKKRNLMAEIQSKYALKDKGR